MQWGQLKVDREANEQTKILQAIRGQRRFAWLPVKLEDGTYVWLQPYWCYFRGFCHTEDGKTDYSLWSSSPDDFCPYGRCYLERHGKPVKINAYGRPGVDLGIIEIETEGEIVEKSPFERDLDLRLKAIER